MILRQIRLHPFGGATDRPVAFAPGLNVVLGPNEAGKSTLVNALRSVLFRSTHLSAARFRTEMQAYMPVTGGDTVRVTLLFAAAGQAYSLEKCWGASRATRLRLPGGGELTGPDEVEKELSGLLHVGEGTYNYVLITYQTHLAGTVDELRKNPLDSTVALASLLQRSIFESDGISIERLRMLVRQRENEYFSRWDRERSGPEEGRDFDKPWINKVGRILKCYYDWRGTEHAYREAFVYEKAIDEFAARTKALKQEAETAAAYLNTHARFVADARRRSELETRMQKLKEEIPRLRDIQQQWPRSEEQMKRLHDEVVSLREQYKELLAEQRQTEEYLNQQTLRETYARAQREHERLLEEEGRLSALRNIRGPDVKGLREVETAIRNLQIKVESQKLALQVEAKKSFEARLKTSAGDQRVRVEAGESISETTKGAFELSHADWALAVRSATDDAVALQRGLEAQTARHAELCRNFAVANAEEAALLQRSYEEQSTRVEKAKSALQALTGRESYEAMAQRVAGLGTVAPGRSVSVISELMKQVTAQGENKSRDERDLQRQCAEWVERYVDPDHLLDLLLRYKQEAAVVDQQVQALAPLPEGVVDATAYVADFDRRKERFATQKEDLHQLLLERATFEKNEPDESLDELEDRLRDVRARFRMCARGRGGLCQDSRGA